MPREFVPGAKQLAIVAAKNTIADGGPKFDWNRAFELYRQIGNAAARIEYIRSNNCRGGANINTGLTAAAVITSGVVAGKWQISVDFPEHEP